MRELITRALSGLVYVGAVVGLLYLGKPFSLILFGLFGILGFFEFRAMFRKKFKIYWTSLLAIIGLCSAYWYEDYTALAAGTLFFPAIFLALSMEHIFTKGSEHSIQGLGTSLIITFYLAIPLSLAGTDSIFDSSIVLTLFILIWCNDTFAYLTGRLMGRTPMLKRLSPNKTIEGLLGGILLTGLAAYFLFLYMETPVNSWPLMAGLAVVTSVFSTLGDLFESGLKRSAGVKDSGNILPGHGGILDRIDSFLFVVPAAVVYLFLVAQI